MQSVRHHHQQAPDDLQPIRPAVKGNARLPSQSARCSLGSPLIGWVQVTTADVGEIGNDEVKSGSTRDQQISLNARNPVTNVMTSHVAPRDGKRSRGNVDSQDARVRQLHCQAHGNDPTPSAHIRHGELSSPARRQLERLLN